MERANGSSRSPRPEDLEPFGGEGTPSPAGALLAADRTRSRRWAASTSGCRALLLRQRRYACSARVCTVWLWWLELAMVSCRSGPRWASIGLAHDA